MEHRNFKINNIEYKLDFEKLFEFIFNTNGEKNVENEITQIYTMIGSKSKLRDKQDRELKTNSSPQKDSIRYDIFKYMLEILMGVGITPSINGGMPTKECNMENIEMSFGEKIILNTLIEEDILVKI